MTEDQLRVLMMADAKRMPQTNRYINNPSNRPIHARIEARREKVAKAIRENGPIAVGSLVNVTGVRLGTLDNDISALAIRGVIRRAEIKGYRGVTLWEAAE